MPHRVEINMSSIKIAGLGGLGMVAMVGVVAYARPEVRQFVLWSYGIGLLGAAVLIIFRRWVRPPRPHRPTLLAPDTSTGHGEEGDTAGPEGHTTLLAIR